MKLIQALLQNAADPHQHSPEHGSVLHANAILLQLDDRNLAVFCLFLRLGVNVNHEGGSLVTPLQAAAYTGSIGKVRRLPKHGARVTTSIQESRCGTALHAAVAKCRIKTVQMLLDKGPDLNAKSGIHGTAILAAAASLGVSHEIESQRIIYGNAPMVGFLLRKGANVNDQCEKTKTVLQSAMGLEPGVDEERSLSVVTLLLKHKPISMQ
jgi:ankyrin repeat protein